MAIGEFGGAAAVPEGSLRLGSGSCSWPDVRHAGLLALRNGPGVAQSGPRLRRCRQAVLQESRQSLVAHRTRQDRRRRLRTVRALDAPLRQAGVEHRLDADRRASAFRCTITSVWERPFCRLAAFRARVRASAAPSAAEAAHRRADVRPLCDAAARHGGRLPAQPRRLHHRMGRRAHGAAVGGPLRSRRLHRLRDLDAAFPRRRRARHRGLPAVGAGARRGGAHGGGRRSARAAFDGADGRPDRHPDQPDRRSICSPTSAASTGSGATSSPRCRSRIRASCATSIRASCSSTAS